MENQTEILKYVPESPTIPGYYGAKYPVQRGKLGEKTEYGTHDINNAPQFDTREECQAWCDDRKGQMLREGLVGIFVPIQHGWG